MLVISIFFLLLQCFEKASFSKKFGLCGEELHVYFYSFVLDYVHDSSAQTFKGLIKNNVLQMTRMLL